jgi:hypothetical protein
LHRRDFLKLLGTAGLAYPLSRIHANDWEQETPLITQVREYLEGIFRGRSMALDFRRINRDDDEEFRIQINALQPLPVASCFKSLLALYYFLNTPKADWAYLYRETFVYRSVVFSDNLASGILLKQIGERIPGGGNAIEKFNDFLRVVIGIDSGLHTWNWEGAPTVGLSDERFAGRMVDIRGKTYPVENVFTPAELARGYDFLLRGEHFTRNDKMREAIQATKQILSIPAKNYRSPIERVFKGGYTGKDGILPSSDIELGRVVDDAGILTVGANHYIVSFMSAGESEATAIYVLREVIGQLEVYEQKAV